MALIGVYLVAAMLLVVAGAAKASRPGDTARALTAALPWWPGRVGPLAVRAGAALEAGLGVAAIVWPSRPLAVAVACSYAGFGAFVLFARVTGGPLATCGCFGAPDTPPTLTHVVVDGVLLASAVAVAGAAPHGVLTTVLSRQYAEGVPLVAASALASFVAYLALSPLTRLGALRALRPGREL